MLNKYCCFVLNCLQFTQALVDIREFLVIYSNFQRGRGAEAAMLQRTRGIFIITKLANGQVPSGSRPLLL